MPKSTRIDVPGTGCWYSAPSVTPSNWRSAKASTKKAWQITYRYYDPSTFIPGKRKGEQFPVKGMNHLTNLVARQEMTQLLLEETKKKLQEGFNPITGREVPKAPDPIAEVALPDPLDLTPDTPFPKALAAAIKLLTCEPSLGGIKSTLKYATRAINELKMNDMKISEVRKKHITLVLLQCGKGVEADAKVTEIIPGRKRRQAKEWTPSMHNHYRTDLMNLFRPLEQLEVVDINPVEKIEIKPVPQKIPETLTPDERRDVDDKLRDVAPNFHRFTLIFFHSGAREEELLRLLAFNVDLSPEVQSFKILVKKGRQYKERMVPIKDIALPFWQEVMRRVKSPTDYVFSEDFLPGPKKMCKDRINRPWKEHIKDGLGIKKDFYNLKHLNATEMRTKLNAQEGKAKATELVVRQMGWTTPKMLNEVYDVEYQTREDKELKSMDNPFVPIRPAANVVVLIDNEQNERMG